MLAEKILELQNARGQNAKKAILKKYSRDQEFCMFLYYALNPLRTYHLSEETLRSGIDNADETPLMFFNNVFECCEFMSGLRGADDATVRQVCTMLRYHCSEVERDIYSQLLAKTIRLGVTGKTVNKIIPDLIPEWEVQQAYPINKYPLHEGTEFWLTQKLNGVRATFYRGSLYARSGQTYTGVDHITSVLAEVSEKYHIVLDGELTLLDRGELSDNEAFRVATGVLNSDDVNKTQICYTIFDAIPTLDFESAEPSLKYSDRRDILNLLSESIDSNYVRILPVLYHGSDQQKIWELLDVMIEQDNEGLMVNTDVPYYRKRHRGILKVKQFYTMDLPIVRCEEGSGRLKNKLGAFVLDFNGNEVKVGSGFSDEQRNVYWQKRNDLADVLCEVKYKEVSSDKNTGLQSLQFPVFVRLRDDKFDVSYG